MPDQPSDSCNAAHLSYAPCAAVPRYQAKRAGGNRVYLLCGRHIRTIRRLRNWTVTPLEETNA